MDDFGIDIENETDTRSKVLPSAQKWSKAERDRDMAGLCRVILLSIVLMVDLQFGLNPFTISTTCAAIPLFAHLKD